MIRWFVFIVMLFSIWPVCRPHPGNGKLPFVKSMVSDLQALQDDLDQLQPDPKRIRRHMRNFLEQTKLSQNKGLRLNMIKALYDIANCAGNKRSLPFKTICVEFCQEYEGFLRTDNMRNNMLGRNNERLPLTV